MLKYYSPPPKVGEYPHYSPQPMRRNFVRAPQFLVIFRNDDLQVGLPKLIHSLGDVTHKYGIKKQ
jgi:hypothetical protein